MKITRESWDLETRELPGPDSEIHAADGSVSRSSSQRFLRRQANRMQYKRKSIPHPQARGKTRLLGEPFVQAEFDFFLRDAAILAHISKSTPNLLQYIEMVLNVLNRTVLRQPFQQGLSFLFGC